MNGKFGNATATETDTTNSSDLAKSSTFTANATAGGPYTVAATASEASAPANYKSGQEVPNVGNNGVMSYYAPSGVVRIDSVGNVRSREQDYNDGDGITSMEPFGEAITGNAGRYSRTGRECNWRPCMKNSATSSL